MLTAFGNKEERMLQKIKEAAKKCPVDVIKYDEDDDVLAEMVAYDDGASNEAT